MVAQKSSIQTYYYVTTLDLMSFFKKKKKNIVGPKDLGTPAHLISSPRPTPRRKKCSRTNEGNLDCQIVLSRTTLSSTGQNHRREMHHVARGNPLEDRKRDSKPYGLAIGEWWRDNPRRSSHLRIKYPQLTPDRKSVV